MLGIPVAGADDWAEATFPDSVRFALHRAHEGIGEIGSGTMRIDFEVADIDEAAERLRAAGVDVGEIERDFEVVDPDGYRVHLFQPPVEGP